MSDYKICHYTHKALRRYMALLLSLAILSDRICFLPAPVRQAVLFILRPGEAMARAYVTEIAVDFGVWPDLPLASPFHDPDSREAAAQLAHCFRALADLLDDMMVMDLEYAAAAGHPRYTRATSCSRGKVCARVTSPLRGEVAPKARVGVTFYPSGVPPPLFHPTPMLRIDPPPRGEGCQRAPISRVGFSTRRDCQIGPNMREPNAGDLPPRNLFGARIIITMQKRVAGGTS